MDEARVEQDSVPGPLIRDREGNDLYREDGHQVQSKAGGSLEVVESHGLEV